MQTELVLKWKRKAVLPSAPAKVKRVDWLRRSIKQLKACGLQTNLQVGV